MWLKYIKDDYSVFDKKHLYNFSQRTLEYALYERVKLYSVLAVPVKPRPCGFLVVRNPQRYVDAAFADVLQLLAFVALVNINDIMQRRMRKLVRSPKDIRSANDIYIKLFGDFEFITDTGTLTSEEARKHLVKKNMPKCLKNWQN